MGRVAVVPLFVAYLCANDPLSSFVAALIFTFAGLTDILDGLLARRLGLVTMLGKFMDPLADKLVVMAALVVLTRHRSAIASGVVILLLAQ